MTKINLKITLVDKKYEIKIVYQIIDLTIALKTFFGHTNDLTIALNHFFCPALTLKYNFFGEDQNFSLN